MAKQEENPLFVGITNSGELRRNILECSKDILESLKEYEKVKSVKEEKQKLIQKFREDIKAISRLINRLKTNLPKVKEVGIKKPEKEIVEKQEKPKVIKVEKPKEKTELERLESELNDIEGKLNTLS